MTEADKGDSAEVREWLDALDSVEAFEGMDRADALLEAVVTSARRKGARRISEQRKTRRPKPPRRIAVCGSRT